MFAAIAQGRHFYGALTMATKKPAAKKPAAKPAAKKK
jgi:hypothetical protein